MYYNFNLKELIYEIRNKPIWLRYVTIRKIIANKYPELSHGFNRELTSRLMDYAKDFLEYNFCVGTEYIITEGVRVWST